MSRKSQIKPYLVVDTQAMSAVSFNAPETNVFQTDVVEYLVTWTGGAATNGDITIQATHDTSDSTPSASWFTLDFGSTISMDTASGTHQIIINQVSFVKTRVVYTRTNASASGTFSANVLCTSKGA